MFGDEKSIDVSRGVTIKLANGENKNMNVNGSVTPVIFEAKPPIGKKWRITRMVGYLNGIQFKIKDNLSTITAFYVTVQGQEV